MSTVVITGANDPERFREIPNILKFVVDHSRNYGPCRPARRVYTRLRELPPLYNMGYGQGVD